MQLAAMRVGDAMNTGGPAHVAHANCRTMGLRVSMAGSSSLLAENARHLAQVAFPEWSFAALDNLPSFSLDISWAKSAFPQCQQNDAPRSIRLQKNEDSDQNSFQKQIQNASMRKNARRAQPHTWTQKLTDTALNLGAKGRKEGARLTQRRADAQGVGVNVNEVLSCKGALPPAS